MLISILYSSFSGLLSYFFTWKIFPCFLFCLHLCVCFYILGTSAACANLKRMALCRWCPVEPSDIIPPGHQSQALKGCPLCGFLASSCCARAVVTHEPFKGGFLFSVVLEFSWIITHLFSKPGLWGSFLSCAGSELECLVWSSDPLLLRKNKEFLLFCYLFSICLIAF